MTTKVTFEELHEDVVADGATDVRLSPVVPNGRTFRLLNWGWSAPPGTKVAIQWGTDTIRSGYGNLDFNPLKGKDFVGDGATAFRFVRINESGSDMQIVAWGMGVLL